MMPGFMPGIDWSRVVLTDHMPEAAVVEAQCQVVFDFGGAERACYEITVLRPLKGAGAQPFVAIGRDREQPQGYRPFGDGPTPEEALQECLAAAGVYHRRRAKQSSV